MLSLFVVYLIEWQKKLEFEKEGRKNHRGEPYVNYLAALQPFGKEPKSILTRIFWHRKESQADSRKE